MDKKKSNKISKFQQQIRKKDKPIVSRTLPTRQMGGIFVYSFVLFLIYRFSAIIVPPTPFAWGDCKH